MVGVTNSMVPFNGQRPFNSAGGVGGDDVWKAKSRYILSLRME